jgi:hydroxyacylglutathione hydrolase
VAVICGTGYRSTLATSLLERAGRADVVNVRGGWSAWMNRQCAEPDAQELVCRQGIGKVKVS